jgi:hypothetical protein
MFCPACGQQQASNSIRFCSRCGFSLDSISELLTDGGASKALRKGVRQGVILMLSAFVLAPLLGYILTHDTVRARFIPYCMFLFFIAALMRILYALFFEGNPSRWKARTSESGSFAAAHLGSNAREAALPPGQTIPMTGWPQRVTTAEVVQPPSVAESTTKLLDNEK